MQCANDVVAHTEVTKYLLQHLLQVSLLPVAGYCPHLSASVEMLATIQDFLASPSVAVPTGWPAFKQWLECRPVRAFASCPN